MMRFVIKALRSPLTLAHLASNKYLIPNILKMRGVKFGSGCRFSGVPSVKIVAGATVRIGDHVQICSRFDSNSIGLSRPTNLSALKSGSYITIGDGSGMSGVSIVACCGITIGENVTIGAGACIWDTDFHPIDPQLRREHPTRDAVSKPIVIEDDVFIGANATILKGVTIGRQAVVGASAVVSKSVKAGDIVAGNPARTVGSVKMVH